VLVLLSLLLSIWCSVHHYFPLLSWSSCVSVAQSFVVYMVFCPPLFSPSFLVIVFWCCPVFCCLYGVLSTIISPFFPGHRVLVLPSLLLSIWCTFHHYFPLLSWSSCFGVAQTFVVYIVFCPPLFSSSFLVIVFWYCPVFCCLYGVQSTIIFPFFPGHRDSVAQSFVVYMVFCPPLFSPFFPSHHVLVLPSLLLST
jgi:hypothetical protein